MEIKYWILVGLLTIVAGFIKYIGDIIVKKFMAKFEEIINSIHDLTKTIIIHTEQLKHNEEKTEVIENRIHNIENDIRMLEKTKQDKC